MYVRERTLMTILVKKMTLLPGKLLILFLLLFFSSTSQATEEWIYTTQQGDNLWKLSKTHLVSLRYWKALQELNGIKDPLHIPVGKKIRFPVAWLKSGSSVGQIVALSGNVYVTDGGGTRRIAYDNMILWENYSVETSENSSVTLQFSDGSKLQLLSNSNLNLGKMTTYGSTGMAKTRAALKKGRTENRVTPKTGPASRFEISTPSAIAAVRGTDYRIATGEDGESQTEVLGGEVGVQSGEVQHVLPKGYGMVSYRDKQPIEPVKLLEPPELSGLPETIRRLPAVFGLPAMDKATAYRLQIGEDPGFTTFLHDKTFSSNKIPCPELPDGNYFLRVRGINEHGLEGLDSVMEFVMDAHPLPPLQVAPVDGAAISDAPITFHWTEPKDGTAYHFILAEDKDFSQIVAREENIRKTTFEFKQELEPGLYYWGVATTDASGKTGPLSDPQLLRRVPFAPDTPDAEISDSGLTVRWHRGTEEERYRCQIANDPDFTGLLADEVVTEAQYQFAPSSYGSYYIRLATIDTDGYQGPFSSYQKVVIPAPSYLGWIVPAAILLVIIL